MDTKSILTKGIEVVIFLFAAFGNFLINIAPPGENNSAIAVGLSSMFMLFLLLFITAVAKGQSRKKMKKVWLSISLAFFILAVISSFLYTKNLYELTFPYPPEEIKKEYIAGTVMTPAAKQHKDEYSSKTNAQIVAAFGGPAYIERVWTDESIRHSKLVLTFNYVTVVLCIAIMLFSLTEGILTTGDKKSLRKTDVK